MAEENVDQNNLEENAPSKKEIEQEIPSGEEPLTDDVKIQQTYEELQNRFLRLAADFENYKKRSAKDLEVRTSYVVEQFAVEILEVADNLDRALSSDDSKLRQGLEQISKALSIVLEKRGISPIVSLNNKFDPSKQEAIAYVPSDFEEGIVIGEIIRGYSMNENVIRCAKVAVSKGKEKEE